MPIVFVAIVAAAALAFTPQLFNDGDTSWHLATGRFILETLSFPHHDPFSFTFRGQPWTAHEWLADLVMARLLRVGGWGAVSLLFALVAGAILFIVGREVLRSLPLRYVMVSLAGLAAVLAPGMLARPHVIAWLLLTVWTLIMLRAREARRAPPAWAALLMLLWANLHASYLIGLALAAVFALEALIEERDPRRSITGWALFGLLSVAAAFVTPHGVQGFLYPFQVSGMRVLPLIDEWRPTRLPQDLAFVLVAAVLGFLALRRWRSVGLVRLVLLAGLTWMAVAHSRHQALFVIVGFLAVLPRSFGQPGALMEMDRRSWVVLFGGVALVAAVRLAVPLERRDGTTYPGTAIAHLRPSLRSAPVLNSYSFGGPLILHGIAPFIDGRADMYGDDFTILHSRLTEGDMAAFRSAVRRWDLRWTMLTPEEALVRKLDQEPGWRRAYADRWAVVHVRAQ